MGERKTLHLNLKKKWFDMILSGEKKEEYRELKPYYFSRFLDNYKGSDDIDELMDFEDYKHYDTVTFSNGYSKDRRQMIVGVENIHISIGLKEWGANNNYCFIISLGDLISTP